MTIIQFTYYFLTPKDKIHNKDLIILIALSIFYAYYIRLKMNKKVGMLLQKSTDTRGVYRNSSMRKSIYLLKTTPSSHTHRFHPLSLATPTSCSPHRYIPPTLHNCHPYFELCTCKLKVWTTIVEQWRIQD